jgi:hypothetical protein
LLRNIQLAALRDNEFKAIVAISEQIFVAKEETWAERRSGDVKLWEDRLHRCIKRSVWRWLEINVKAAPSVLLAPFPDWITLRGHCSPFGRRNGGRPDSGAARLRRFDHGT